MNNRHEKNNTRTKQVLQSNLLPFRYFNVHNCREIFYLTNATHYFPHDLFYVILLYTEKRGLTLSMV